MNTCLGGRNARQFAAAHSVNEQTFYNWLNKYDKGEFSADRVTPSPGQKRARSATNGPSFTIEKKLELIDLFKQQGA
jgi:transposase-like protein